jgi:hypothetical protein
MFIYQIVINFFVHNLRVYAVKGRWLSSLWGRWSLRMRLHSNALCWISSSVTRHRPFALVGIYVTCVLTFLGYTFKWHVGEQQWSYMSSRKTYQYAWKLTRLFNDLSPSQVMEPTVRIIYEDDHGWYISEDLEVGGRWIFEGTKSKKYEISHSR